MSVLLPVREPAPWLHETLKGLQAQKFVDWDLVLVIHGEDQSTSRLVHEFEFTTRVIHASAIMPFPELLNHGLEFCEAPFVARIDSDDVPLPNRLSSAVDVMDSDPRISATAGLAELIDRDGKRLGSGSRRITKSNLYRKMRWRNQIAHSAVTFRREDIKRLGGYSTSSINCEDYELWLRVLARGRFELLDETVIYHRVHSQQVSRSSNISIKSARSLLKARVQLAKAQQDSVIAAHTRHLVWTARQVTRQGIHR